MWATVATAFKLTLNLPPSYKPFGCQPSRAPRYLRSVPRGGSLALYTRHLEEPLGLTLLAALLNPVAYYLILFEAYDRLPAQLAQPINITWTIVLALMAGLILKQPVRWITPRQASALACSSL